MTFRQFAGGIGGAAMLLMLGCASPLAGRDAESNGTASPPAAVDDAAVPASAYRSADDEANDAPMLGPASTPDDYVRYALYHSPQVEAALQRWRTAAAQVQQVSALPDPRLSVGFFLNEVETRVGPQQARLGAQQTFPWPGKLGARGDAAAQQARAAWRRYEAVRLDVTEAVVAALHEVAYLDAAVRITEDNLDLLRSFEEIVRARYRLGTGSHPELVRVQVELGQLEDRLAQLRALRPTYVAQLNATLNRASHADVSALPRLPGRRAGADAEALIELAEEANPTLRALEEEAEAQRALAEAARKDGLPDVTIGLDYIITDDAMDSSLPESGDDAILLSFGVNVPIWREKYDAAVRQAVSTRLAKAHQRAAEANQLAARIQQAWFDHTDAHRRVELYEQTLIPKAEESLRASLAAFRAGETSFLDLLDAERTLLEFALSAERARADRGTALARLGALVGADVPTTPIQSATTEDDTADESEAAEVQQ
jgi:outer membrane protein TolC